MSANSRIPVLFALLLGACTSMPSGPSVLVLPGTGKDFEQFRGDDLTCRQFAGTQVEGTTPGRAAAASGVASAVVGTILGAAAGAAADGGHGAGVGAGAGMAIGGLTGAGTAQISADTVQQRYDNGYQQCMYAKGHRVPIAARFLTESSMMPYPPPPPGASRLR